MWYLPNGGSMTDSQTPAKSYGYVMSPDLTPGEGYLFRRVGDLVEKDDEYWIYGQGPWTVYDGSAAKYDIGYPVLLTHYPVRYRDPSVCPKKWTCGHPRDIGEEKCCICAVIYYKLVKE